jgi:hypothetical protein
VVAAADEEEGIRYENIWTGAVTFGTITHLPSCGGSPGQSGWRLGRSHRSVTPPSGLRDMAGNALGRASTVRLSWCSAWPVTVHRPRSSPGTTCRSSCCP